MEHATVRAAVGEDSSSSNIGLRQPLLHHHAIDDIEGVTFDASAVSRMLRFSLGAGTLAGLVGTAISLAADAVIWLVLFRAGYDGGPSAETPSPASAADDAGAAAIGTVIAVADAANSIAVALLPFLPVMFLDQVAAAIYRRCGFSSNQIQVVTSKPTCAGTDNDDGDESDRLLFEVKVCFLLGILLGMDVFLLVATAIMMDRFEAGGTDVIVMCVIALFLMAVSGLHHQSSSGGFGGRREPDVGTSNKGSASARLYAAVPV